MKSTIDLTKGNATKVMLTFAIPMIIGNAFQQLYNVVDSIIVGKFIGPDAVDCNYYLKSNTNYIYNNSYRSFML